MSEDQHPIFRDPERLTQSRLERRGWTREMIEQLLGEPDERPENPMRAGQTLKIYHLSRVKAAEAHPDFRAVPYERRPRRQGDKPARTPERAPAPERPYVHERLEHRALSEPGLIPGQSSLPLHQIELHSLAFGSTVIPGRIRVSYQAGATGTRMLRASGKAGWITAPGGGKQGEVLGRVVHIIMELAE